MWQETACFFFIECLVKVRAKFFCLFAVMFYPRNFFQLLSGLYAYYIFSFFISITCSEFINLDKQFVLLTKLFCTHSYIVSKKLATLVEGDLKAPFSIATTIRCRVVTTPFPGLFYFTLDPYLIMLSAQQSGIKYHFLSLWYDSTWDWTPGPLMNTYTELNL